MRKTLDKPQLRDGLQNTQPALLRTVKVIKNKPSQKLSQPTDGKENKNE
jgi:hypothetical protein